MPMADPTKNKRAGARFELDLLNGFRDAGFPTERLRLAGKHDEGDLVVDFEGQAVVVEAKAGVMHPADFVRQAALERDNYAKARGLNPAVVEGVAVVKARGKSWRVAYVLTTVREFFGLSDG